MYMLAFSKKREAFIMKLFTKFKKFVRKYFFSKNGTLHFPYMYIYILMITPRGDKFATIFSF